MSTQRNRPLGNSTRMLSALVALGGAGTASAIELGEITVQSHLGQPLRASIAYALAPNEELRDYCVSATAAAGAFPTVSNTRVSVRNGVITLSGTAPIREPMITTRVSVNCPYTPNISREYLMFIDPASVQDVQNNAVPNNTAVAPPVTARPAEVQQTARPANPTRRSAPTPTTPVVIGSEYRVQPGDSLSKIVQRISDRDMALWPAVNEIFAANPDAFIGGDPNRLKAGSVLAIPQSVGGQVASSDSATVFNSRPTDTTAATSASPAAEPATADAADSVAPLTNLDDLVETSEQAAAETELVEGVSDDNPYVPAQTNSTAVLDDVTIESPEESSTLAPAVVPNRSIARVVNPVAEADASRVSPAVWWSIGGLGLIAALLVFRRRFRNDGDDAYPAARYAEEDAAAREPTATVEVAPADFGLDDDSPTDRNLALDASIIVGNDMDGGIDVDFTEAFDGTTELDLDLNMAGDDSTDIIPPPQIEASSILQQEVMPEDDDYDMSMVVDITKAPDLSEVTARDLQAVEVTDEDADNYTMNTQTDLEILAQDYQDELSATQALNMEIERAAQELVETMGDDDKTEQLASDISDDEDTGINETVNVTEVDETAVMDDADDTARLEAGGDTVDMLGNEDTREMPSRATGDDDTVEVMTTDGDHTVEIITRDDEDETVEMEIEGGRFNTRKG